MRILLRSRTTTETTVAPRRTALRGRRYPFGCCPAPASQDYSSLRRSDGRLSALIGLTMAAALGTIWTVAYVTAHRPQLQTTETVSERTEPIQGYYIAAMVPFIRPNHIESTIGRFYQNRMVRYFSPGSLGTFPGYDGEDMRRRIALRPIGHNCFVEFICCIHVFPPMVYGIGILHRRGFVKHNG